MTLSLRYPLHMLQCNGFTDAIVVVQVKILSLPTYFVMKIMSWPTHFVMNYERTPLSKYAVGLGQSGSDKDSRETWAFH